MLKRLVAIAAGLIMAIVVPATAMAQTVTTPPWGGNGNNGLIFDVQATNALTVTNITSAVGDLGAGTFELYSRPGTYVGNAASSADWVLVSSGSAVAAGPDQLSFTLNVAVPAGQTQAFYLRGVGAGVGYVNGLGGEGSTWASDANLTIREGGGLQTLFGGITNTPRALGGSITYATGAGPAPIPTMSEWAMILLGLTLAGGTALYIQRRRMTA